MSRVHARTRTASTASSSMMLPHDSTVSGAGPSSGHGHAASSPVSTSGGAGRSPSSDRNWDQIPNDMDDDDRRPAQEKRLPFGLGSLGKGKRKGPRPSVSGVHVPLLRFGAGSGSGAGRSPTSSPSSSPLMTSSPGPRLRQPPSRLAAALHWARVRPRRSLAFVVILLILVIHFLSDRIADGIYDIRHAFDKVEECAFVSPVEAYHHDLARLRELYGWSANVDPAASTNATSRPHSHAHHTFSSTGHLLVSPAASANHPIPQLLQLGEKRWEELLSRQSRTLRAAVKEYTRRYGRAPPAGFDQWWAFAIKNTLVLPDEYDGLNRDIAPFFGLPRDEIQRRLEEVQAMEHVFTVNIARGKVGVDIEPGGLKWAGTKSRARDVSKLIKSFAKHLPDLKATFSIFDQPQVYMAWERHSALVALGEKGKHTTHLSEPDQSRITIANSCASDSRLRNGSSPEGKSFIYDSLKSSDFCQNPYLVPIHGITIEPHTPASEPKPHTKLLPLFSLAKTTLNSDILVPPLEQFFDKVRRDPAWEDKTDPRLAWRGLPTGISMMTKDVDWRSSPRFRLHAFANNHSTANMEYLAPDMGQDRADKTYEAEELAYHTTPPLGYRVEKVPADEAAEYFFDMKLSGKAIQCSKEDGTCDDIRREVDFAPRQTAHDLYQHKFLFDVDGNGWSGRFRRLMGTNSVVIKTAVFTEWFQPHLIPWFHYIPSKLDFGDLADIMAFFAGSPRYPDLAFDETAKALGRNGQCFVQRMYRSADLEAYMFRLFLEYARLVAEDGVDMDFHYDEAKHGTAGDGGGDGGAEEEDDVEDDASPLEVDASPIEVEVDGDDAETQAASSEPDYHFDDGTVDLEVTEASTTQL